MRNSRKWLPFQRRERDEFYRTFDLEKEPKSIRYAGKLFGSNCY